LQLVTRVKLAFDTRMARKNTLQTRLEFFAAKAAFSLLGLMPRKAAIWCATRILLLVPILLPKLRGIGLTNLAIAFPERSLEEREAIFRGTFENLGRVIGEMTQFHKYDRERLAELIDFQLDETSRRLYALQKAGTGVLITTGHMGNWEMLVLGFAALYEPISFLARPLDNPLLEQMLNVHRTRYGNEPISKRNSVMLAARILSDGGILGVLSDVNVQQKDGVFVPFFGELACTTAGPAMLAIRSGALIYPTFCVWDKEISRYRFVHGAVVTPRNTGDRKQDVIDTTAAYTSEIEKIIRRYPDQWMWIHKRWKTRPPGEAELY